MECTNGGLIICCGDMPFIWVSIMGGCETTISESGGKAMLFIDDVR